MVFMFLASNDNIINVHGDVPVQLSAKDRLDSSVEGTARVAKPLWHSYIAICAEGGRETGLLFL